jgi:hypothetical protein
MSLIEVMFLISPEHKKVIKIAVSSKSVAHIELIYDIRSSFRADMRKKTRKKNRGKKYYATVPVLE